MTGEAGEPRLLVLKIGGSLLSDKHAEDGIDAAAFDDYAALVADLAAALPGRLILVTGGGARCHPVGRMINASAHDPYAAVALTEPAAAMRWEWTARLRARGIRAVPLQSTALLEEAPPNAGEHWTGSAGVVASLLRHGAVPVLSSDCVLTSAGALRILSSDETPAVALELGIPPEHVRIVALTDVPGIVAGADASGPVVPYVDPDRLDDVRPWFWDRSLDATGAMAGKVEALAAHARRGAWCVITRGRRDAESLRHLMRPPEQWPADTARTVISRRPRPLESTRGTVMTDPTVPATGRVVLLNPGPVNVHERVRAAIASPDECHREPEAAELFAAVADKLVRIAGGGSQHAAVLLTGSGTAALEAVVSSAVPDDGGLLVLGNGHYAERLAEIAAVHRIRCTSLDFGWANPIEAQAAIDAFEADPSITHVAMVHHETSTGMLNPVGEIGAICARYGKSLILDAISSLGAEDLDLCADRIDWCVGTANKCLEGLPGISFVCAPAPRFAELEGGPRRTLYLDLHGHYVSQVLEHSTRFTPALQVLRALDTALDLALAEGVPARKARYSALADAVRAGLTERGIDLLLETGRRAGSITNAHLWGSLGYTELHDRLKARGYIIYATQGKAAGSFRLANMGQLTDTDIAGLFAALDEVIADHPVAGAKARGAR